MDFLFNWVCTAFQQCVMWLDLGGIIAIGVIVACSAFIFSLARSRF